MAGARWPNLRDHLNTARLNATFEPNARYGGTLGYFSTDGSRNAWNNNTLYLLAWIAF